MLVYQRVNFLYHYLVSSNICWGLLVSAISIGYFVVPDVAKHRHVLVFVQSRPSENLKIEGPADLRLRIHGSVFCSSKTVLAWAPSTLSSCCLRHPRNSGKCPGFKKQAFVDGSCPVVPHCKPIQTHQIP